VFDIGTVGAVGSAVLTIPSTGLYLVVLQGSVTASINTFTLVGTAPVALFGAGLIAVAAAKQFEATRYVTAGSTFTLRGAQDSSGGTVTFDVKLYRTA